MSVIRDTILIPVIATLHIALFSLFPLPPAGSLLLAIVVVVAERLMLGSQRARMFVLSPLALLFLLRLAPWSPAVGALLAIAFALLVPLIPFSLSRRAITYVIAPAIVLLYPWTLVGERMPRLDLFEDGHSLLPAGEMLRGELPYRDILPGHGLLSDGVIDYAGIRAMEPNAGGAIRFRHYVGGLNAVAIYGVALAVSGIAEVGLLAFFVATWITPAEIISVRAAPALLALAFGIAALRLDRKRYWLISGILAAVAIITSVDFAAYTVATLLIGVMVSRGSFGVRARNGAALALGIAIVMIPLLIGFAIIGIADDFVLSTAYVGRLADVYETASPLMPPALRAAREAGGLVRALTDTATLQLLVAVVVIVIGAVLLLRRSTTRARGIALIAVWALMAAYAYAQRQHLYFNFVTATFLVSALWLSWRSRVSRAALIVAAMLILLVTRPLQHFLGLVPALRSAPPAASTLIELKTSPQARGAVVTAEEAQAVQRLSEALQTLPAGSTYLDFANMPSLYFLLDRPSPIRYYEVPFFQPVEAQREVIRAIETDPTVRAALVGFPHWAERIDGVDNRQRAPLVWDFITKNFEPAYERDGVVLWKRK